MIDVKKLQLFNKGIYGNSVVGSLNANTLQFTKTGNPWWGESNPIEPPISSFRQHQTHSESRLGKCKKQQIKQSDTKTRNHVHEHFFGNFSSQS